MRQQPFILLTRYTPVVKTARPKLGENVFNCQSGGPAQSAVRPPSAPSAQPFPSVSSETKLLFSSCCFPSSSFNFMPPPAPLPSLSFAPLSTENTQSTYRVSPDGSLRATFASGMEINLSSEPHILAGAVNPTLGKCNISLPGEHNANLIEWRQRKEQNKGNVSAFERRLRVRPSLFSQGQKFMGSLRK